MKLTIEETDGSVKSYPDIRQVTTTETKGDVFTWWERTDGRKYTHEERRPKPRRIVLEFEDEASVNYGQVRR